MHNKAFAVVYPVGKAMERHPFLSQSQKTSTCCLQVFLLLATSNEHFPTDLLWQSTSLL